MISRFLLFLSVVFLGIGQIWGQTTVTSNFGATSGDIDDNISFTTQKNEAQTAPAWNTNSNELRLYFHSSGNGGSVTLHPAEGIIITDVSLTTASTSYTPTVKYNIDGGGDQTAALSGTTYTISGIEASDNLRIRNANTTNTQLRLTGITVTYEFATTDPIFNTSSSEITNLGYMEGNASASQSFSLSGMNLEPTSGNITVTAPANFQVSTDDVNFSNSLTIPYTAGSLSATDLYVKLNNGLSVGNYNGDITISGGSANATLNVEGIVTEFSEECVSEDFENIPTNNAGSYLTRTWTGNGGIEWTVNDSRTDQTITGKAIGLRNSTLTTTSPVAGGVGTLSFDYKRIFSGNSTLKVFVNGTQYGDDISVTSETPANFSVDVNLGGDVTIELINSGGNRIAVDNLNWTCSDAAPADTHFRSQANGDWTSAATWESSSDGLSWADATTYPGATAESVVILAGNTVNINSASVTVTNTQVYGTLEVTTTGSYSVSGEEDGVELTVENGGTFLVSSPGEFSVPDGNAWGLVKTGGKLVAGPLMGEGSGTAFANAYLGRGSGLFYFGDASVCEWANPHATLGSSAPVVGNRNFFAEYEEGDMPIFRVTVTPGYVFGNNSNDNVFHSVLEIIEPATFSVRLGSTASPQKTKTFVGGVRGSGKLIMESDSGPVIIGNSEVVPELGGTATIVTNITDNRLRFPNGANVTAGSVFTIENSENTQNIAFERQGNFDIHGTLDITNMRITNTAAGGVFVKDGGTLRTRHTDGLFGDSSAIVNATNFTMETGSTIDYYATEDQTISTGKEYYHLILSGAGTKTSSDVVNVHTAGSVTITGNPVVDFTGHNLASTSANTTSFTMDGGRLILGKGGTQPNMRGTYNLSGGVIEFANSSASGQTIRSTNAYSYQNIEVTGNSVGTSGGNLVLNENGTFVVKPNGIFTININSIIGPEGNQTIEIEGNGTFRTGNADGFSGGDGTSNPGQTTSIRNNIENIILHPNSIVEYSRSGDQTITDGIVTTPNDAHYQNLRVSGSGVKTTALGNLVVNNITYVDAATLRVAETNNDVAPNVLTARKGIQVVSGATALFENNANLMQDADAVNSGDITVERFVQDMDNDMVTQMDYVYWSSPVSPQGLQSFSPGSQYVLRYNESNDLFYYVNFGTEPNFILGKGYAFSAEVDTEHPVNPTGYDETYSFTGTPHNGNIVFNDLRKNSASSQGFNLVGNPYPSNIDADELFAANSSIYATVLFWTNSEDYTPTQQGSDYSGNNYAIYNKTGGNPATDYGGAFTIPSGLIKTGQGFMVQKKEVGTGPLVFNNDMRTTTNGTFYQKSGLVDKDRFWLTMTTYQGVVNTTLIGYIPGATNDFEQDYDAELMGGSDAVYTILGDKNLSIQGREYPFNTNEVIPLGLRFYQTGKFIIDIKDKEGIFDGSQRIYLKDKYLNKTHILSQSYYEFESHEGEYNDRFELFFRPSFSTSVENPAWTIITQKQKDIFIYTSEDIIKDVEIVNLFGWPVYRQSNVNATELRIPSQSLGKQILVVKVKTESGKIETKKIINK